MTTAEEEQDYMYRLAYRLTLHVSRLKDSPGYMASLSPGRRETLAKLHRPKTVADMVANIHQLTACDGHTQAFVSEPIVNYLLYPMATIQIQTDGIAIMQTAQCMDWPLDRIFEESALPQPVDNDLPMHCYLAACRTLYGYVKYLRKHVHDPRPMTRKLLVADEVNSALISTIGQTPSAKLYAEAFAAMMDYISVVPDWCPIDTISNLVQPWLSITPIGKCGGLVPVYTIDYQRCPEESAGDTEPSQEVGL